MSTVAEVARRISTNWFSRAINYFASIGYMPWIGLFSLLYFFIGLGGSFVSAMTGLGGAIIIVPALFLR